MKLKFILPICLIFSIFSGLANAGDNVSVTQITAMQQLYLLKQVKPDLSKLGILCQLEKHPDLVEQLKRAGANLQIMVFVTDTYDLRLIAKNFKHLVSSKQIEALWVLDDPIFHSQNAKEYLVKESVLAKILFATSDPELVKRGATLCAQKADKRIIVFLNKKSLGLLGLEVPESLNQMAEIIYQ